jgi:serine/threonine-protein kinase
VPERYLGQTLGKYRIESLLGSGGFAWVFKGYDPELDIPVAVKVLKPQFAGEQAVVDRFKREASTAARLRHPNIIKIYAVGRDGTAVYFVMDYLPGGLSDRLEATASLPEDYVLRVGVDVARALGFAHREGVIHRDIKVDNILFDSHGNAVVADFGIARALSGYTNQTGTNMVVGTPQYFAPEQARAKPLDGRADIYSLGVTLFRAATGRLPFEGEDWYEIARQHVEEPPPSPREINQALSPEFEALVLKCLAKSPEDRPPTGEELADAMMDVLHARRDVSAASTVSMPSTPGLSGIRRRTPSFVSPTPQRTLIPAAIITTAIVGGLIAMVAWPFGGDTIAADAPDSIPPVTVGDSTADTIPLSTADRGTPPLGSRGTPPRRTADQPKHGTLRVSAPPDAQITLDNRPIGTGSVREDSLAPGNYTVRAEIPSMEGCVSNRVAHLVRIEAGGTVPVSLNPRPCGSVTFLAAGLRDNDQPVPGVIWYRFQREGSPPLPEGQLPLLQPVVLEAGHWTLRLRLGTCVPYEEEFDLAPGEAKRLPTISLLCGPD